MKNNVVGGVFAVISIFVGFIAILVFTPYVNEFYFQQGYAYWTGKILTMVTSAAGGVVLGVIFYGLTYWIPKKIIEKNKSKK